MEIIKEFDIFLKKFKNDDYGIELNKENKAQLIQIKKQLKNLDFGRLGNKQNEFSKIEDQLMLNLKELRSYLKSANEDISIIHLHTVNSVVDESNIDDFMRIFNSAVFLSTEYSIVSTKADGPWYTRKFGDEEITDPDELKEICEEVEKLTKDEKIATAYELNSPTLEKYLKNSLFKFHVIFRYTIDENPLYIMLHYNKSFLVDQLFGTPRKWQPARKFLKAIVSSVSNKSFPSNRIKLLKFLDEVKLNLVSIYKECFLNYIRAQLAPFLAPETSPSKGNGDSPTKKKLDTLRKKIEANDSQELYTLQLNPNLPWDGNELNLKLKGLFDEYKRVYRKMEERSYYLETEYDYELTNFFIMEFNGQGNLRFQNTPIPSELSPIIAGTNKFLRVKTTRNMKVLLNKNKRFFSKIEEGIQKARLHQNLVAKVEIQFENYHFDITLRKKANLQVDSWRLTYNKMKNNITKEDKEAIEKEYKVGWSKHIRESVKKYLKPHVNPLKFKKVKTPVFGSQIFAENTLIEDLRSTIIQEYFPETLAVPEKPRRRVSIAREGGFRSRGLTIKLSSIISNDEKPLCEKMLKSTDFDEDILTDWSFDVCKLESTNDKSRIVWLILNNLGLIENFKIENYKLINFISKIEQKYNHRKNPFHNYDHGVSVMHAVQFLIRSTSDLDMLSKLALTTSALCHDVDHTGRTNMFEVNSLSQLAITHNDKSVLEQHHASTAFEILKAEECNIFQNVQGEDYKRLRKDFIYNILSTDMKEHSETMNSLKGLKARIDSVGVDHYEWSSEDIQKFTGMMLHCADLSGPTKDFEICYSWSMKINQEFSNQVKDEIRLGIPVTPWYKDLDQTHIMAKAEISFLGFVIKPMWEFFNEFTKSCGHQIDNLNNNIKQWEKIQEEALQKMKEEPNKLVTISLKY